MFSHQARTWAAVAVGAVAVLMAASLRSASEPYSGKEWAAPGGDWASTRYSTLSQINAGNVKQLGGAWAGGPARSPGVEAPLMVKDGRMFVPTSQGTLLALDPASGGHSGPTSPRRLSAATAASASARACCLPACAIRTSWRSARRPGRWSGPSPRPEVPSQGMSSAPAYGNGVVVGVVSRRRRIPSWPRHRPGREEREVSLELRRRAGPGETGHDTWPQDSDIWKYGGGALWTTPSVDAELGLVYLETGNAVPQWGGELRPGNNLFDNSVVALDLKTGKMRWYQQAHSSRHLGARPQHAAGAVRRDGRRTSCARCSRRCGPTASRSSSIARPASRFCRLRSGP